jgi:hypothetical protein
LFGRTSSRECGRDSPSDIANERTKISMNLKSVNDVHMQVRFLLVILVVW